MTRHLSKNSFFHFGLIVFVALSLSIGVALTTGKASLNSFLNAQVQVNYCREQGRECAPGGTNDCCPGLECKFREANYSCEAKLTTFTQCINKTIYSCLISDPTKCTVQKLCTYGCTPSDYQNSGNINGREAQCNFRYTKCLYTNVYKCIGSSCSIKYVCQNGCTPSDSQISGVPGGVEANCISTYNRFPKCSPDKTKILQCDGTYCTTVITECSKTREVCTGTGTDVHCQDPP